MKLIRKTNAYTESSCWNNTTFYLYCSESWGIELCLACCFYYEGFRSTNWSNDWDSSISWITEI